MILGSTIKLWRACNGKYNVQMTASHPLNPEGKPGNLPVALLL